MILRFPVVKSTVPKYGILKLWLWKFWGEVIFFLHACTSPTSVVHAWKKKFEKIIDLHTRFMWKRNVHQKGIVTKEKIRKAVNAYRNASQLPYKQSEIQELKIYVDKGHETVILPIFGVPTPFHISTLKNLSSSVEGDYTYLRLNFFYRLIHTGIFTLKIKNPDGGVTCDYNPLVYNF